MISAQRENVDSEEFVEADESHESRRTDGKAGGVGLVRDIRRFQRSVQRGDYAALIWKQFQINFAFPWHWVHMYTNANLHFALFCFQYEELVDLKNSLPLDRVRQRTFCLYRILIKLKNLKKSHKRESICVLYIDMFLHSLSFSG